LARKPNYQFEKRKKELDRKAKRDARDEDRRRRRAEGAADTGAAGEAPEEGTGSPNNDESPPGTGQGA
jgi:hypothetical protein